MDGMHRLKPLNASIASQIVRLWLTVLLVAILVVLVGLNSRISGLREYGVSATNPPSPYFHYAPKRSELQKVLVVHGLDANKELMNLLCFSLSDAGFNVYSMDLPGHGDSTVPFDADTARKAVLAFLDSLGPETVVVGHSMGATLLLDIANERSIPAMVLLSPAPTAIDEIHVHRVLVMTGQFDLPRIPPFVPQIEAFGGIDDFQQKRISWAGHSTYVIRPEAVGTIVRWLGGDPDTTRTVIRSWIGNLELVILIAIPLLWLKAAPTMRSISPASPLLISYVAACAVASFVSAFFVVTRFLHLFASDYLIGFAFLTGIALLPASLRRARLEFSGTRVSGLAILYVLCAAAFIVSERVHLTLSDGRWWRFLAMIAVLAPLSYADEVLLRPIRPWWKAAGAAALTRIFIWGFVITAVLTTNRDDAFLALIAHFVVAFSIGLWISGEWIWRRTRNPLAAAAYSAVVQAWVLAAVFVLR